MDDCILSARESPKLDQRAGGFSGGDMGLLGEVATTVFASRKAGILLMLALTRTRDAVEIRRMFAEY